jgi:hypothetical protein
MTEREPEPSSEGAEPLLLDLGQFDSIADAFARAKPGDRYLNLGALVVPHSNGMGMTLPVLFWFSMLARSQGLHEAIAREIPNGNPHAVFPLIRAYAESLVLVMYVLDHPEYVEVLTRHPRDLSKDGPKRKTIQALISYAEKHVPGMKAVYAELSEATHFGSKAMWAFATSVDSTGGLPDIVFTSATRWSSDEQALIACAQTIEIATEMTHFLRLFAERWVLPQRRD